MPSKVMIANGNPFVLALMEALGLPKNTQWFELRCALDEAVTVRCGYSAESDGVEGFDPKPLLRTYQLMATGGTVQRDPEEAP